MDNTSIRRSFAALGAGFFLTLGAVSLSQPAASAATADVAISSSAPAEVHVPVNVCGNAVSVVDLLAPVFGNTCVNAE